MTPAHYNLTPAQMHDAAITLENDGDFYARYKARGTRSTRREQITRSWPRCCGHLPETNRADREQLRRYFDSTWSLPAALPTPHADVDTKKIEDAPTIEFWLDSVKYPNPKPVPEGYKAPEWYKGPGVGSFYNPSHPSPGEQTFPNHGRLWTNAEEASLAREFCSGAPLKSICRGFGRTPAGILARLGLLGFLKYNASASQYIVRKPPFNPFDLAPSTAALADTIVDTNDSLVDAIAHLQSFTTPRNQKETIMNTNTAIEITTKTLVNGVDVNSLSDAQIYDAIAKQEAEITKLDAIKNKPQRLRTEIERRQAGIKALVDYLDSKDSKGTKQEDTAAN